MRALLSILGALTGAASVIGMLVGAVWTIGTMDAGFRDLARRMGLAEMQMAALTTQVIGMREAVIRLQDSQPTRHADAPAFRSPAPQAPSRYTERTPPPWGGVN